MKPDKLKQFVALRQSLLNEKTLIERRLIEINNALGEEPASGAPRRGRPPGKRTRGDNPMSLKDAVQKVTRTKPLTKKEILEAIHKLGYRFTAKDPTNSLNVVLYTKGQFKNQEGKFSPAR